MTSEFFLANFATIIEKTIITALSYCTLFIARCNYVDITINKHIYQ